MSLKHRLVRLSQRVLRGAGIWIDLVSNQPSTHRDTLFRQMAISRVIDVGAHTGEFVRELHSLGWSGLVDSFEPDPRSFPALEQASREYEGWAVHHIAVGAERSRVSLHLAGNEVSSSTRGMLSLHVEAAPSSAETSIIDVEQDCLDSLIGSCHGQRVMLKIDVQGSEMGVLRGAESLLNNVVLAQIELSLQPLYEDQALIWDVLSFMNERGFVCCGFIPVFHDPAKGIVYQVDGVFVPRRELSSPVDR